jgi:squalene-associated FAD-dependent desaturase
VARRVHVVGAGIAGLAAAVELAASGYPVTLHEQAGHAGGRCRSFFDDVIGRSIDNGNHLVLSGNRSLYAFLRRIGATDRLSGPARAAFPFIDLQTGERWTVRPGSGPVPWWIFVPKRRVRGTRVRDYLAGLRFARARERSTVAECVGWQGPLYRRFWEPLAVAVLNTQAREASARLLWPVLRETFGRGEAACRPRMATRGLSDCFIDPALAYLREHGAEICFQARLRSVEVGAGLARRLDFTNGLTVPIADDDFLVLAVPPAAAAALLPGLVTPEESRAIVNAHFRVSRSVPEPTFIGLVGAISQWIFLRDDVVSVTVSAANGLVEEANEVIAAKLWREVCLALEFEDARLPAWRIVKEKRATFAQIPAQLARRPGSRTCIANVALAGDWTDTGLPATLEGSVRSGHTAVASVLASATSA